MITLAWRETEENSKGQSNVSELDETWNIVLAEAERRARQSGENSVADYLSLRQANDLARQAGLRWLWDTFRGLVGEANRVGAGVTLVKTEPHRFTVGAATMVGTQWNFSYGVRSLTIAAGWPRAPGDGFVRGGGLACGQIRHFGMTAANEELLLMRGPRQTPQWLSQTDDNRLLSFPEQRARWHVGKFLGVN